MKAMKGPLLQKFAVCTGCRFVVEQGPYFTRRILRHLRSPHETNHDAMEIIVLTANNDPRFFSNFTRRLRQL